MARGVLPGHNGSGMQPVGTDHIMGELELARHGVEIRNLMVSSIIDQMATAPGSRGELARALGYEYQGDRDVYTALGYTKTLTYGDFAGKFERGDIARRIVTAPVQETWKDIPLVNETLPEDEREPGERTDFETAWDALVTDKALKAWHLLRRADLISGIGRWGVVFLGFDDADKREDFEGAVEGGDVKLAYMTPMTEVQAAISTFVDDAADPRFGQPEYYQLQFMTLSGAQAVGRTAATITDKSGSSSTSSTRVHWSRVLHIAEGAITDDVVGSPRLEAVFNRLTDLDRVVGSTGEAFWRNAFPGVQFALDPDFSTTDKQDIDELKTQIDKFVHRWERYIRTKGVTMNQMDAAVSDPKGSFEVILSVIAGTTGIPQRILVGSERGELSSAQDQAQWAEQIEERREQHVGPVILDEFIARLISVGALPEAKGGWAYIWPDLHTPSQKDKAEVAVKLTEALAKYSDSLAAGDNVPLSVFLRSEKFMGFSEEEATKIEEANEERAKEELKLIEEEALEIPPDDGLGIPPDDGLEEEE